MWDTECRKAFNGIKQYLTNPPVLAAPVSGKPFLLYIRAMDHVLRDLLAQTNENGHEQEICYLSRTMIRAEYRYNHIEKECLALVFTVQKMRHYLVGQIKVTKRFKYHATSYISHNNKLSPINCSHSSYHI